MVLALDILGCYHVEVWLEAVIRHLYQCLQTLEDLLPHYILQDSHVFSVFQECGSPDYISYTIVEPNKVLNTHFLNRLISSTHDL
ncbi:unnamed protein product [Timema podura]|uniref:Uncharacterized protein n=1 Tax=Timema podura TaxID=61482 RepID=A0ABN7NWS3_TIMPD|nr:unnamed protein product [Timema podura]